MLDTPIHTPYIYPYIHPYIHPYKHPFIHPYIHIYKHPYTHTHTYTQTPPVYTLVRTPTSARPEVRGTADVVVDVFVLIVFNTGARIITHAPCSTADVGWRSLFPIPLNPPRTHSRLYRLMCLRTDGQ